MTDCLKFKDYNPNYLTETTEPPQTIYNITSRCNTTQSARRYDRDDKKIKELINGSIDEDIVVNIHNREAIPEEGEETKKILNNEREEKREMYMRQARVLYPEKEEWCLQMAVDAFLHQQDKGIDILTHKFEETGVDAVVA